MTTLHAQDPLASPLGKPVSYRNEYAPDLLFPVARAPKRQELGLDAQALPFHGLDLWNAYELSWLETRGKPVVALAEFRVPATSPCLIESKSLKLYLNSFNQSRFADAKAVRETLIRDLSQAAGATVEVSVFPLNGAPQRAFGTPRGILLDTLDITIDRYEPEPGYLSSDANAPIVEETLYSHLLKSNCLVTGQPDWGMAVIRYRGAPIDREGLLRYLVSFRNHNEFHEQCVERIFCDVQRQCAPEKLEVWARYTRRGGLDINPWRSSENGCEPDNADEIRQ
ncbi:NADPH-dependent 7-cyano-7-deazaguanine reductase QueF [Niveibacterium terrae]|uniref:NADPH-dependent 7-cyano-7-deazaguanine reductase QueF n=1 Tax=Niveibacterium terrae TaxID=3373598 RepID=UPI003A93BFC0